jgi:hypothetical protein
LRRSDGISGDNLEGSCGVEEMKSFVKVMECSRENLGWFGASELEGGFEE